MGGRGSHQNRIEPPKPIEEAQTEWTWLTLRIASIDGYVLHDGGLDLVEYNDEGSEISRTPVYRRIEISASKNYDFTQVQVTDINGNVVTAYGDRLLYTLPESAVPADSILGGGTVPDVEVMIK